MLFLCVLLGPVLCVELNTVTAFLISHSTPSSSRIPLTSTGAEGKGNAVKMFMLMFMLMYANVNVYPVLHIIDH